MTGGSILDDYNRALKVNPTFAAAYYNRGMAWCERNCPERAAEDFARGFELAPEFVMAHHRLSAVMQNGSIDRICDEIASIV